MMFKMVVGLDKASHKLGVFFSLLEKIEIPKTHPNTNNFHGLDKLPYFPPSCVKACDQNYWIYWFTDRHIIGMKNEDDLF